MFSLRLALFIVDSVLSFTLGKLYLSRVYPNEKVASVVLCYLIVRGTDFLSMHKCNDDICIYELYFGIECFNSAYAGNWSISSTWNGCWAKGLEVLRYRISVSALLMLFIWPLNHLKGTQFPGFEIRVSFV